MSRTQEYPSELPSKEYPSELNKPLHNINQFVPASDMPSLFLGVVPPFFVLSWHAPRSCARRAASGTQLLGMPPQCWTRDWNPASLCTSSASRSRSSLLRAVVDQIEPRQPTSAPPLAGSTPGEPLCGAIGWIEVDQHIRNALHGIEVPNLGACRPRTRRG